MTNQGNQNFMALLQRLFGAKSGGSVGANTKSSNSFGSVQTGAGKNAMPLSEMAKKQKEKQKETAKKKRKKALNQTDSKDSVLPSLNNKQPAQALGTLKIGLNLNNGKPKGGEKKSASSQGLNLYR